MNDMRKVFCFKEMLQTIPVVQIQLNKLIQIKESALHVYSRFDFIFFNASLLQAGIFQFYVVIGIDIINAYYPVSHTQQSLHNMKSNKSGCTSNDYFHLNRKLKHDDGIFSNLILLPIL